MRCKSACVLAWVLLSVSVGLLGPAGAARLEEFEVAGWKGYAYDGPEGRFSFCSVSSLDRSGTRLDFLMGADYRLSMRLVNDTWSLAPEQEFPVTLRVERIVWTARAKARSRRAVEIGFGNDIDTIELLQRGRRLDLATIKAAMSFDLAGSRRALAALVRCVSSYDAAPANPFDGTSTAAGGETGPAADYGSIPDRAFASGLLQRAGFRDFAFVDLAGSKVIVAMWEGREYSGSTRTVVTEEPTAKVIGESLTRVGRDCQGRYSLTARPLAGLKDFEAQEGSGRCDHDAESWVYWMVFMRDLRSPQRLMVFDARVSGTAAPEVQDAAARMGSAICEILGEGKLPVRGQEGP
jgi:hypothetical protein